MGRDSLKLNKSSLNYNWKLTITFALFILHFTLYIDSHAQTQVQIMPSENLFPTITTNYFEPRVGLAYFPSTGYFKVDAGKSVDLLQIKNENIFYSFGGEFFMHALGLNIKEKRLPIDAADGYFGINFNYYDSSKYFKGRLRILHNSAHFVDGHQERNISYQPKENYVNDFFEFTFLKSFLSDSYNFDFNFGGGYPIIIHPKELHKANYFCGFEYSYFLSNNFLSNRSMLLFAYSINLSAIPKYIGNNHLMFGIKFGDEKSSSLRIYISYYNGQNLFKQYYGLRVNEFSFGFLF